MTDNTRAKLTIDPTKDVWGDTELKTYVKEGLTKFYAKAIIKDEWEDGTIALLVAGQGNYTKPSDLRRIIWAKLVYTGATSTQADESPLEVITDVLGDFQKLHDMDAQGDQPQYFYEEGGELWVYPVPNATAVTNYTIKYKYSERPAVLSDSESPAFAAEWHFVLEDYAVWRAWNRLPDKQNEAATAKAVWEENWRQAVQDLVRTQDERLTWRQPILPSKNPK